LEGLPSIAESRPSNRALTNGVWHYFCALAAEQHRLGTVASGYLDSDMPEANEQPAPGDAINQRGAGAAAVARRYSVQPIRDSTEFVTCPCRAFTGLGHPAFDGEWYVNTPRRRSKCLRDLSPFVIAR